MNYGLNYFPNLGLNMDTGYGKIETAFWNGLVYCGYHLRPVGTMAESGLRALSQKARDMYFCQRSHRPYETTLAFGDPDNLDMYPFRDTKNYLFTMSESNRPSDRWVESINRFCHMVIVPAPDLVHYYKQAGIEVPVVYLKMGITPLEGLSPKRVKSAEEPFIFASYSLGDSRKNVEAAIMAFKRLYDKNPRYKLIIKARDKGWINGLNDPQIEIVNGIITDQDWLKLLDRIDCFIFPSHGEGFGYPPREAVLAGVPTIATPWLGMFDVHSWGYPIYTPELIDHRDHMDNAANHREAKWALPDVDHLASLMKSIETNYEEAIRFTQKGREYLLQNNSWKECTDSLFALISGVG